MRESKKTNAFQIHNHKLITYLNPGVVQGVLNCESFSEIKMVIYAILLAKSTIFCFVTNTKLKLKYMWPS